ncbi:DUF4198 domain-containing protein [Neptunicella marina]|uniref:DUF4198 domain-containing protein n=1 Tax=Neptunicella marina TaxID=2125989 RepID=A0A8J6ILR5_9ALTE|nr:DUF4198 domain-containing protein [Neptunicella marina]MBC3764770.1 DUF4198 domain-containing protein [Neptunicella marina]
MKRTVSTLLAGALALSIPFASQAHRAWFLPAATVLSADNAWVTVDAAVSNDIFHADHAAYRLNGVSVVGPKGNKVELQNTNTGKHRSNFDLQLTDEGTYKIFSASSGLRARWEDANGKRQGWPRRGQKADMAEFDKVVPKDAKNLSVSQFSRRTETFITAGTPSTEVFKPTNQGLELVPVTHPNDLYAGESAQFTLLMDGKPAAGAEVIVLPGGMRYRSAQNEIKAVADEQGNISIAWPEAGMYWLSASYEDNQAKAPATNRRGGYSATFEVLPQ